MNPGDIVRYKTGEHSDNFSKGKVIAIERFRDLHGERTWVYVNWFDFNGRPDNDEKKHHEIELELVCSGDAL